KWEPLSEGVLHLFVLHIFGRVPNNSCQFFHLQASGPFLRGGASVLTLWEASNRDSPLKRKEHRHRVLREVQYFPGRIALCFWHPFPFPFPARRRLPLLSLLHSQSHRYSCHPTLDESVRKERQRAAFPYRKDETNARSLRPSAMLQTKRESQLQTFL